MASSSSSSSQLPTLGGAWRAARDALSFSSTRARQDTGVHVHRIDRYSNLDTMSLPGQRVESRPFSAGGHEWKLVYYPNGGAGSRGGGHVAVDLMLTAGPWWRLFYRPSDVTAAYSVSILDGDGNRAFSKAMGPHRFGSRWSSTGVKEVAKVEGLRSALRSGKNKDDGLLVRCDVTVMKLEKESRIMWYLRQLVKD
ncbi:unnamed protein product [Urochloa decumbens]|uniref:MATH domain-containing protein n=1 Tax=Urochloa decumbens TaxID=240449 RepID=A0ABC9AIS2_9POAL